MSASIAKDFDEEIGCTVDDDRVLAEISDAVHKPAHFHNPADPVQIAIKGGLRLRDDIQSANPRRLLCIFDGLVVTDLADVQQVAVPEGHLARDVECVVLECVRHIVRGGRRRIR